METTPSEATPASSSGTLGMIGLVLGIVLVAVVVVLLTQLGGDDSDGELRLVAAAQGRSPASGVEVMDGGQSLLIDGDNEYGEGASVQTIADVLRDLGTPSSIVTRMSQTRALDGMQEASWSGLTASWNYHPDSGLDIVIEEAG